jgi:type IV pilus assembly protein PilA
MRHTGLLHQTAFPKGFTLVEIAVVLCIIGILALMAFPNVSDAIVRKRIEESLTLANLAKEPIEAAWKSTQTLLPDNASAGLPVPEKVVNRYIKSVAIDHGAIHVVFSDRSLLKEKTLSLRPAIVTDAKIVPISWVCGYADAPEQMTAQGDNKTDVPSHYLPLWCR